jgi:hypothetical protein
MPARIVLPPSAARPAGLATWGRFEAQAPELADAGRRLLAVPGFGFGYLATVSRAGRPRIHPINPIIVDGHLVAYIVPSPKLADLREGRPYALHSTGSADIDDEFLVTGRAVEVTEPSLRAAALAACHFVPDPDHVLVEFAVERVLWGHYQPRGRFPPQYLHWRIDPSLPTNGQGSR